MHHVQMSLIPLSYCLFCSPSPVNNASLALPPLPTLSLCNPPPLPLSSSSLLPSQPLLSSSPLSSLAPARSDPAPRYKGQIGLARTAESLIHTWGIPLGIVLLALSTAFGLAWLGRSRAAQRLLLHARLQAARQQAGPPPMHHGSMDDVYVWAFIIPPAVMASES